MTGKATRVDLWPMRLDVILRTSLFDSRTAIGWLVSQLTETVTRLAPDYEPPKPVPARPPMAERRKVIEPDKPFMPRWRRRMTDIDYDDDKEKT